MISGKRRVDGDEILFRNGEDKKRKKVVSCLTCGGAVASLDADAKVLLL